jgi:hypothetical protein
MKKMQLKALQLQKTAVSNLTEIIAGAPNTGTGCASSPSFCVTCTPSDPTGNYSLPLTCDKNC